MIFHSDGEPHPTPIGGRLGPRPDDFRVDEVAAYPPAGHGEHLFVRIEKRALTTPEAVRRLAAALSVARRDCGFAGLKDRNAVTTQWVSVPGARPADALSLELDGVRVLEAVPHPHKLRTGHLRGNRFHLGLDGVPAPDIPELEGRLARLGADGLPNYFGAQRFGRGGQNGARARRWLVEGGRAPRDRFERKLLASALQSELFNAVLERRVRQGVYARPLAGDLMQREPRGGLYVAEDVEAATAAARAFEATPTGPMVGPKMREPDLEAGRLEAELRTEAGVEPEVLRRMGRFGPGTRRRLRVRVEDGSMTSAGDRVWLSFGLPKGAYATVLVAAVLGPGSGRDAETAEAR